MKFGTWTYGGDLINLEHIGKSKANEPNVTLTNLLDDDGYIVEKGIDMSECRFLFIILNFLYKIVKFIE